MRNSGFLGCLSPSDLKPEYTEHQKAAVSVVNDYLAKNYDDDTSDETDSASYIRLINLSIILLLFLWLILKRIYLKIFLFKFLIFIVN